jgi:hypothetical protein
MFMRKRLVLLFAALLLVTTGYVAAQGPIFKAPTRPEIMVLPAPDSAGVQQLGFRVTVVKKNRAFGKLVTKVNGVWVDAELDSHNALAAH